MKIGILGTGGVGRTLATGFIKLGYQVKLGARDAANEVAAKWVAENGGTGNDQVANQASHGTFEDATQFGDVVILATKGRFTEEVLDRAGIENFAGKLVLDANNPLEFVNGPGLFVGRDDSLGERVQRWLPNARVVKAFNMIGAGHFFQPQFSDGAPTMFIAGNDAAAKQQTTELLRTCGWETFDAGGIEAARYLEPMALLWITTGMRTGTWNHGFKMLQGGETNWSPW